jgi:hypothetical protein
MGFIKSFLKSSLSLNPQYLRKHEQSKKLKEALFEYQQKTGCRIYCRPGGGEIINFNDDVEIEADWHMHIELIAKNDWHAIYIGAYGPPSPVEIYAYIEGRVPPELRKFYFQDLSHILKADPQSNTAFSIIRKIEYSKSILNDQSKFI